MTAKTGNVSLSALADNRSFDVAVAGAATLGTAALTGTVLTTVSRTEATAELGQAVTVRADDSVGVGRRRLRHAGIGRRRGHS